MLALQLHASDLEPTRQHCAPMTWRQAYTPRSSKVIDTHLLLLVFCSELTTAAAPNSDSQHKKHAPGQAGSFCFSPSRLLGALHGALPALQRHLQVRHFPPPHAFQNREIVRAAPNVGWTQAKGQK